MLRATVIFAFFCLVKAQVDVTTNVCEFTHVEQTEPLNFTGLDGLWNLVSSVSNSLGNGDCTTVTFDNTAGTLTIWEMVNGVESTQVGNFNAANSANDLSRFTVTFNATTTELFVVGTNYDGYALMYNCEVSADNLTSVWVWVLSRSTALSNVDQTTVSNIVSSHPDLNGLSLLAIDHSEETCNGSSTLKVSTILLALVFGVRRLFEA